VGSQITSTKTAIRNLAGTGLEDLGPSQVSAAVLAFFVPDFTLAAQWARCTKNW
jgi:hypothetical protein